MGISTNIYTIHGIKIPFDESFNDAYDEVYNDLKINIIIDGMSGEYMVFGIMLFNSGDIRYGLEGGDNFKELKSLEELIKPRDEYIEEFCKYLPEFRNLIDIPWTFFTFTHYS